MKYSTMTWFSVVMSVALFACGPRSDSSSDAVPSSPPVPVIYPSFEVQQACLTFAALGRDRQKGMVNAAELRERTKEVARWAQLAAPADAVLAQRGQALLAAVTQRSDMETAFIMFGNACLAAAEIISVPDPLRGR